MKSKVQKTLSVHAFSPCLFLCLLENQHKMGLKCHQPSFVLVPLELLSKNLLQPPP